MQADEVHAEHAPAEPTQADGDDRSIVAAIARSLGARIVTGALRPGAPLRQDHVAAEFRTSHVPVREAFRRLEAQGLVSTEPRKGARVAPLDPAGVREIAEMRAALETLALRQAAPRLSAADIAAAHAACAASRDETMPERLEQANRRFHLALTVPCGMPRLNAAVADLHRSSARYLFAAWRALDWAARSDAEHDAILAAVEAGDSAMAEALLAAHIRAAGHALAAALKRPGERDA
jgi:DNA-binding GntR family transcriptional regulator